MATHDDVYCTWCESDDLEDHRFEECGYYALQREAELKKRLAESEETVKNVNRANDDMLGKQVTLEAKLKWELRERFTMLCRLNNWGISKRFADKHWMKELLTYLEQPEFEIADSKE